jgi:hypothetical protein
LKFLLIYTLENHIDNEHHEKASFDILLQQKAYNLYTFTVV